MHIYLRHSNVKGVVTITCVSWTYLSSGERMQISECSFYYCVSPLINHLDLIKIIIIAGN